MPIHPAVTDILGDNHVFFESVQRGTNGFGQLSRDSEHDTNNSCHFSGKEKDRNRDELIRFELGKFWEHHQTKEEINPCFGNTSETEIHLFETNRWKEKEDGYQKNKYQIIILFNPGDEDKNNHLTHNIPNFGTLIHGCQINKDERLGSHTAQITENRKCR